MPSVAPEPGTCRFSGSHYSPDVFRSVACANCLLFIYLITPPHKDLYHTEVCDEGLLICPYDDDPLGCTCENKARVFNIPEFALNASRSTRLEDLYLSPPLPEVLPVFTKQCCEAAVECCQKTLLADDKTHLCPATWDGWQCFEHAEEGEVAGRCPKYIYGDHYPTQEHSAAIRHCTKANGWFHPLQDREWTDYSGCKVEEEEAQVKLIAGIISFSISVLAIIPALLILFCFRSMRVQSVFVIHRHLLLSFLLSGLAYLFNVFFFIVDGAPGDMLHMTNSISCRVLFAIQLRFLRLSTFSWMLAEGVYLFRLLRNAFSDESSLMPYKIICWGGPLVLTIVYCTLRQIFDNEGCWISPSIYDFIEWTVMAPCLIAICTNLALVTVILFILVKKLRYNPHLEPMQYRKAVRAALMLVPVFGLHFLFTIYRIPSSAHQVLNLILDGLQGFAVSIILCYANRSVTECAKKWLDSKREIRKINNEQRNVLRRCESARSAHKKSLVEQQPQQVAAVLASDSAENSALMNNHASSSLCSPLVSKL